MFEIICHRPTRRSALRYSPSPKDSAEAPFSKEHEASPSAAREGIGSSTDLHNKIALDSSKSYVEETSKKRPAGEDAGMGVFNGKEDAMFYNSRRSGQSAFLMAGRQPTVRSSANPQVESNSAVMDSPSRMSQIIQRQRAKKGKAN